MHRVTFRHRGRIDARMPLSGSPTSQCNKRRAACDEQGSPHAILAGADPTVSFPLASEPFPTARMPVNRVRRALVERRIRRGLWRDRALPHRRGGETESNNPHDFVRSQYVFSLVSFIGIAYSHMHWGRATMVHLPSHPRHYATTAEGPQIREGVVGAVHAATARGRFGKEG